MNIKRNFIWLSILIIPGIIPVSAQDDRDDKAPVTYEIIYDEPYSVNKLFIGFQPLYGELFTTNINAGFGMEATYYHKDKFDVKAHFRKTYSKSFYDFNRSAAALNSQVSTKPEIYNYYELGGTYHIKDFESESKTKMVLYRASYKGNSWAARVPLKAEVPSKLRKIYGARLGGIVWNSTADFSRVLEDQGLTNNDLVNDQSVGLPLTYIDQDGVSQNFSVFGNIYSAGLYTGGSITFIRNTAVSFEGYEGSVDDGIINIFLDLLYSPLLRVDPVTYQGEEYSAEAIDTRAMGFRVGVDGKFNRTLSWSYGGELGYRPSIKGSTFFLLMKICFPIYGTSLDYKVESFGK